MSKFATCPYPLDQETINQVPLSFPGYRHFNPEEYPSHAGKEHYRLLAYLSKQFDNSIILDIGTHRGSSALALSTNPSNTVHSFDIYDGIDPAMKSITNIKFHQADLWDESVRASWLDLIQQSKLIFLDVDPHNGTMEHTFYLFLLSIDYQGIVICDDIWYFKEMRDNFWYKVPSKYKLDLTKYGHWSGTGMLNFQSSAHTDEPRLASLTLDEPVSPAVPARSWTMVTGYFDLTKCSDASQEIKNRPQSYYLAHAHTTMGLDVNLIVFCDQGSLAGLQALRPDHLKDKTKYIICEFDDFPLNQYRQKIIENRKRVPSADPRNTPSYYLFCMARYEMVRRTIDSNPFGSTHFGWVNICIERYGYKNVMALEDVMAAYRDKFSTCYIDYIPPHLVNNLPEYFRWGRCSLCSGFFTGNSYYFRQFCDLATQQFMDYLEKGYGHADEQLYSPIYFANRDLFEVYFGDYLSMVTNYVKVVDDSHAIMRNLVTNSFRHRDLDVCYQGCMALWRYCTERVTDKDRPYTRQYDTSAMGPYRQDFLRCLLFSARHVGDTDTVNKVVDEMMKIQYGR